MLSSPPVSPAFGDLSNGSEYFFAAHDRRNGATSDFGVAAAILRRAAYHLINEQAQVRCISTHAMHDAIRLLAHAGRQIALEERRRPARQTLLGWLGSVLWDANVP